jgi:hypothetical protein
LHATFSGRNSARGGGKEWFKVGARDVRRRIRTIVAGARKKEDRLRAQSDFDKWKQERFRFAEQRLWKVTIALYLVLVMGVLIALGDRWLEGVGVILAFGMPTCLVLGCIHNGINKLAIDLIWSSEIKQSQEEISNRYDVQWSDPVPRPGEIVTEVD